MHLGRGHRVGAAIIAAASLLGGLAAIATGIAPAGAAPAAGSSVVATGSPGILVNANNQAAGGWTITLAAGSTWASGDAFNLVVADAAAGSTITFANKPTTQGGNGFSAFNTSLNGAGTVFTISFTGNQSSPTTSAQTFSVTNVVYDVAAGAASGAVAVTPTFNGSGTSITSTNASNATVSPVAGSIVAAANNTMHPSTSPPGAPAGDWTVTLAAGSTWANNDVITIAVLDAASTTTNITFDTTNTTQNPAPKATVPPAGNSAANTPTAAITLSGHQMMITLTGSPSGALTVAQPIQVTGMRYVTTASAATGAVQIEDNYKSGAATTNAVLDTTNASNATIAPKPSTSLTAATTPTVGVGNTSQAAGNWSFGMFTKNSGWGAGDYIAIEVGDVNKSNCAGTLSAPDTIGFVGTPSASVSVTSGQTASPTFSVALAQSPICTGTSTMDEVVLTFTNTGTITGTATTAPYPVTVTISNVAYTLGNAVPLGNLSVASAFTAQPNLATGGSTTAATTGPSNATVNGIFIATNSPAVAVAPSTADAPISNVVITEAVSKAVPAGWVCVTLSAGTFDKSATPAVSASGGGAVVASSVSGSGSTTATLSFDVTTASSTGPATYTLSGLAVDAPATAQIVNFTIKDAGTAAGCGTATTLTTTARAYGALASGRISGPDADGTAVAEMETQFPPGKTCPSSKSVVVATDGGYPDALAASYLAGQLGTGILLTPTNSLSAETAAAIQAEGITTVYVVGGPVAVSDAVVQQLQAQQAYTCGGTTGVTSGGSPVDLTVSRIYGATLYDTAAAIAESTGSSAVGSAEFPGAYNAYDSVGGAASPSATTGTTAVPTAILATGAGFQDATSASPMAYANHFPVLLTDPSSLSAQASSAMSVLGIQQVIVMGGPVAISDNVISQLEAQGLEVVRVAGVDYTDTAVQLALFELSATNGSGVTNGLDWVAKYNKTIELSRGDFYTDGLAGCVVAGPNEQPILLAATPTTTGQYLAGFLQATGATGTAIPVLVVNALGGPQAIDPNLLTSVLDNISAG